MDADAEGARTEQQNKEAAPEEERVIWKAHPSQLTNLGVYALCLLVCGFVLWALFQVTVQRLRIGFAVIIAITVVIALARFIRTRARVYLVTTDRIKVTYGILNRQTEEIELYRVRDYKLTQPVRLRLFGLGNILISTTDYSAPVLVLEAIRDPNGHREQIRTYVERCRDRKRVRVTEMES